MFFSKYELFLIHLPVFLSSNIDKVEYAKHFYQSYSQHKLSIFIILIFVSKQ